MTGLEKIKSQILDEAKAAADSKIAEAKAKADEIVAQAEADAKKISPSCGNAYLASNFNKTPKYSSSFIDSRD